MGMIAFDRNAGVDLWVPASDADAMAAALTTRLRTLGLPGHCVEIKVSPATFTVRLSGSVERQDTRERVVLCCGNVRGVGAVDDRLEVIVPSDVSRWRFVQPGDSFQSIARDAYRAAERAEDLRVANEPLIPDAQALTPGWLLRIPPLECLPSALGARG